jgi:NADPH2:quinone reductase
MRLKPDQFRQDLATLLELLQQKKIKPLVTHRFPLTQASKAQEVLTREGVLGKIVLDVKPAQGHSAGRIDHF